MRHFLTGGGTTIGEYAIAAIRHSLLSGDLADRTDKRGNLLGRSLLGKIVERDVFALRDHQHMRRTLRVDVPEGEDMRILIDLVARNLATQDAGEDVVAIVGHNSPRLSEA